MNFFEEMVIDELKKSYKDNLSEKNFELLKENSGFRKLSKTIGSIYALVSKILIIGIMLIATVILVYIFFPLENIVKFINFYYSTYFIFLATSGLVIFSLLYNKFLGMLSSINSKDEYIFVSSIKRMIGSNGYFVIFNMLALLIYSIVHSLLSNEFINTHFVLRNTILSLLLLGIISSFINVLISVVSVMLLTILDSVILLTNKFDLDDISKIDKL